MFQSIRVRLALSFAAIAVFAVFTLGVVLLVILQNYYSNQEQYYLRSNVWTISRIVGHMMASEMSQEEVQPLLDLGMRLGEGTGAAVAVPVLRAAAALHARMATFAEAGVSQK